MKKVLSILSALLLLGIIANAQITYNMPVDVVLESVAIPTNHKELKEIYATCIYHLKAAEGIRLEVYKCAAGYKTIGWGHCLSTYEVDKFPDNISLNDANELLRSDFFKAYNEVKAAYPELNTRMKLYAITLFSFNMKGRVKRIKGTQLETYIKKQQWTQASMQLRKFNKAKVNGKYVVLSGLSKRRNFESLLLLDRFDDVDKYKEELRATVIRKINQELNKKKRA